MRKKKHWHKHGPPWRQERKDWDWEGDPPWGKHGDGGKGWDHAPPWRKHTREGHGQHPSGGALFFRFALAFGLFVLLGCGVLAALAAGLAFLFRSPSDVAPPAGRWLALFVVVAIVLAFALRLAGRRAARSFTRPLSETMRAADSLAAGDLSARVPVEGSGEFRHFARSFNHMAQALETSDRQRRELLADVAHELRTPLTIIQGNLEGIRDGVYESTPEHIDLVLDETQNLSRLVDDLRLLTLAEAGQLPLDLQQIDVAQLLDDVREAFACQATEAGVTLVTDIVESLPPLIADAQRLGQVLGNLVGNALRHTPAMGQITLGAEPVSDEAVRLWVEDSGEGIPPEDLERIFDRFWRGDRARSRDAGAGSGLGLAIAKSLVEAHNGQILAQSQVGQGTVISCVLPLTPVTSAHNAWESAPPAGGAGQLHGSP